MKTEILLFISQFSTIFLLGFQQQNVHRRHYTAAAVTSVLIGVAQMFVWRKVPNMDATQIAVWLSAGPVGIVFCMWLHPKLFKKSVDKK